MNGFGTAMMARRGQRRDSTNVIRRASSQAAGGIEADLGAAIVGERHVFADTLSSVGPDAPTLCGSWTAVDVAFHVVSLDRLSGLPTFVGRTIVSRGVRLNDVVGRFADAGL